MKQQNFKYSSNMSSKLPISIQEFVRLLYKKGLSDNTITHYRCHINRLAVFNEISPDSLEIKHFDKYFEYCTFTSPKKNDYINQLISSGYWFFKYIKKESFIKEIYSRRKQNHKLHPYLTYEQFVLIGSHVTDYRVKVIMWLCYDAGLRPSEALNLRLQDIDYDNNRIYIIESKNCKSRFAPLSDVIKKYINRYLKDYYKDRKSDFLFPGYSVDRPIYYSNIQLTFRKAVVACGLNGVTLHTLRHAFATMLHESGVALGTIQLVLGHSSATTTLNYIVQAPSFLANIPSHVLPKESK